MDIFNIINISLKEASGLPDIFNINFINGIGPSMRARGFLRGRRNPRPPAS